MIGCQSTIINLLLPKVGGTGEFDPSFFHQSLDFLEKEPNLLYEGRLVMFLEIHPGPVSSHLKTDRWE